MIHTIKHSEVLNEDAKLEVITGVSNHFLNYLTYFNSSFQFEQLNSIDDFLVNIKDEKLKEKVMIMVEEYNVDLTKCKMYVFVEIDEYSESGIIFDDQNFEEFDEE